MHCFEEIYCPHENLFNSERYVDFNENLFVLRDRQKLHSAESRRLLSVQIALQCCCVGMEKGRAATGLQRQLSDPVLPQACDG